jgi:serine phosphatase RsbU (regulator of sigma subunit)
MTGRWDAAIDYLQASIEAGDRQYRPDLLAASINSMYAAEDVQHAVHYLTRGLSGAFGVDNALVWHAAPDQNSLRLVGIAGWADDDTIRDTQEVAVAADRLEARAYREVDSLRGQELGGCVERAVPLVIPGAEPIGVVTIVDCLRDTDPALQRELDLELVGYLNQAARAIHEVHTREGQLLRIANLEQERTAQELRMAREIQVSFLPAECPTLPGWEVAADWRAAREVGGDFYDFVPVDGDHIGLVIADVSDKGVPAALFMSLSWTLMRVTASEALSPALTLHRVNELLMSESRSGMFLTLFYGILNWRTGMLTYARAGHNPPIVLRARTPGHSAGADVVTLMAQGTALGIQRNLTWDDAQVQVRPGDILVLYTDGVTEPINERGTEFGVERLIEVVRANNDRPCSQIISQIGETVADFVGDQPQFDDYTLLGLKRLRLPSA